METLSPFILIIAFSLLAASTSIAFLFRAAATRERFGETNPFWFLKPAEPWCHVTAQLLDGEDAQSHQARCHPGHPCCPPLTPIRKR